MYLEPQPQTPANGPSGRKLFYIFLAAVFFIALSTWIFLTFFPRETALERAIKQVKTNRAAMALPVLEELAREGPSEANAYPWLAQAYLSTDRFAEGRTALDTAFRLRCQTPGLVEIVDRFSQQYQSMGHFSEAERLYASGAQVLKPADMALSKAQMYMRWAESDTRGQESGPLLVSRFDQAISHLQSARKAIEKLESPEAALIKAQIPHQLAETYRAKAALAQLQDKNADKAIALLEESIKAADEPRTRMILGDLYFAQKKDDKAIENYVQVVSQDASNLEARHKLIELYLAKKDLEAAAGALSELSEKERSFENFELLADLSLKLGDYPGAVRALEEASNLNPKPQLLKDLLKTLNLYAQQLTREKRLQEAIAVKGHAERIADKLALIVKAEKKEESVRPGSWSPGNPPVSILSSRNWLYAGSSTPEGEIRIKNISPESVGDLTMIAVFFDHTRRTTRGSVVLPVASSSSAPFHPQAERTLYFSCPNIVDPDHQLGVKIYWKGRFLKEFPVIKQR